MGKAAGKKTGTASGKKHEMTRVICPNRGDVPTWANSAQKGPRCTACGQQGHDRAGDR